MGLRQPIGTVQVFSPSRQRVFDAGNHQNLATAAFAASAVRLEHPLQPPISLKWRHRRTYTSSMDPVDLSPVESPSPDDGDASLIRWMLSLSPEERLAVLQGFVDSAAELRNDRDP